jgi:hypothetical protein
MNVQLIKKKDILRGTKLLVGRRRKGKEFFVPTLSRELCLAYEILDIREELSSTIFFKIFPSVVAKNMERDRPRDLNDAGYLSIAAR